MTWTHLSTLGAYSFNGDFKAHLNREMVVDPYAQTHGCDSQKPVFEKVSISASPFQLDAQNIQN